MLVASLTQNAMTQEAGFRIETDVFVSTEQGPLQQTLTLFSAGVGYDLSLDGSDEITMVDPAGDRIVLLNKKHKLKSLIKISQLEKLMTSARNQAANTDLAVYLKGAENVVNDGDTITVGDLQLQYSATLQSPPDPGLAKATAEQYRAFADALIQYNSFRTGSVPPFARIALNAAVCQQVSLPLEIVRTTNVGKGEAVVRSRLLPIWLLGKSDVAKIAEIGEMLVTFEQVNEAEYRKRTDPSLVAK